MKWKTQELQTYVVKELYSPEFMDQGKICLDFMSMYNFVMGTENMVKIVVPAGGLVRVSDSLDKNGTFVEAIHKVKNKLIEKGFSVTLNESNTVNIFVKSL